MPRPSLTRWLAAALALVAACSPFAASSPPAPPPGAYGPAPPAHRGGTAVIGAFESPDTLDPLTAGTDSGVRAAALAFSPLWGLDPALQPYPDLVRSVPTVANGGVRVARGSMTIDVQLVPGLRWSDGAQLSSDDVIFTWQAIRDPAVGAQLTAGFEHVTAIDRRSDTETLWHLDSSYAAYLQLGPAMTLLPAHRLAALPHAQWSTAGYFQRPDVVSGPYLVDQVVPSSQLAFRANPHYADGRSAPGAYGERAPFTHAPYLDGVVYRLYPSRDALLQGIRAGEVDLGAGLEAGDAAAAGGVPGFRADVHSGLRDEFLNPNHDVNTATGRPPPWVGDPVVLDALALAVDRAALVAGPLQGAGRPSRGLYPAALASWGDPATRLSPDADGARQRLEADGWKAGADGVRVKAGRPLQFSLLGVCPTAAVPAVLDALRQAWSAIGARVDTGCRGRALFFAGFAAGGTNATGAFDMTIYSNQWAPDPAAWAPAGQSAAIPGPDRPSGLNWNRCHDPGLDADLDRVATTLGSGRVEAARAAERDWLDYHCTIPLFEVPDVRAVSGRLLNFAANPAQPAETWNAGDWGLAV